MKTMLVLIKPMAIHTTWRRANRTQNKLGQTALSIEKRNMQWWYCGIVSLEPARTQIHICIHHTTPGDIIAYHIDLKIVSVTHNRCISQSISIYSKKMNDDKLKLFGDPLSLDVLFLFIFVSFIIYFFFPHSFAFASIYIILSTRFLLTLCFLYRHILFVRNVFN